MSRRKSRRLKQNLKRFKRKNVDVAKFVKDLYVDSGMAYISCNVDGYNDIISRYSVKGYEWLNHNFVRFVDENANFVPTEYPIILEICGHRFSKSERECIEATVADYYALELGDAQMALERNTMECLVLFGFSIISVISIWLALRGNIGRTIWEILIVFLCFFIWEFIDSFAFERSELMENKLKAAQVASMKLTFQEKFEDGPVEPEEAREILNEIFEEETLVPSDEWE